MKSKFISSFLTVAIIAAGTFSNSKAYAAGETGHSDLMMLMSMIYGLNPNVSEFISTGNQSMDNVPLAAATQSGPASNKIHFASVYTDLDASERSISKYVFINHTKALAAFIGGRVIGGRTASLGNAESPEMFMKYLNSGDALGVAMGTHVMLDTMAPFHAGYKGILNSALIKIPFGHLTDGTNPDRLSLGKVLVAMVTMGDYFITLREAQRGIYGVNTEWLKQLEMQGINVNDNISIIKWFVAQPEVQEAFKKLPSKTNISYLRLVLKEMKQRYIDRQVFRNQAYLEDRFAAIEHYLANEYQHDQKMNVNELISQLILDAWNSGELNESNVINDIFSQARTGATRLNDLLQVKYEDLSTEVKMTMINQLTPENLLMPWSREWIVAEIVNNYGHGVIKPLSSKFDSSYLYAEAEERAQKIEADAIHNLQDRFFGLKSKYVFNPMMEYWKKVFENWKNLSPELKGKTFFQKIIAASDVIVNTTLHHGYLLKSLRQEWLINTKTGRPGINFDKAKVFFKTIAFLYTEGFFSPKTTTGNMDLRYENLRQQYIEELRANNPKGIFSEDLISKNAAFNEFINRKYNNAATPTGVIQKTANWIVKTFDDRKVSRLAPSCDGILIAD